MTITAFIGLGNMGLGMAANLAKSWREVRAFDSAPAALARAAIAGCKIMSTAREAIEGADQIITMLPAGPDVLAIYREHIISHARKNAIVVDCSTIDVQTARLIAGEARAAGLRPADAPVSGGVAAAQAGGLTFMVGCDNADFTVVEALLSPMARAVIRAGEAGAGQAAKICNNMLLGISMIGVCEAFALAEKLGLDAERFFDIAKNSSGQCWSLTNYAPWPGLVPSAPANNDFKPGFAAAMMLKDLRLAQDAAAAANQRTPLGEHARDIYDAFIKAGHADKDFSALVEQLRGKL
jgi:3-hydroxyisobutyrate dehydrogenase